MGFENLKYPEHAKHKYFQLLQQLPLPSRHPRDYNLAREFLITLAAASEGLKGLLLAGNWKELDAPKLEESEAIRIYISSHGQIEPETMQGFSPELPKYRYLTGFSGPMLSDGGEAAAINQNERAQIRLCSDLPRAIHHALAKYCHNEPGLLDELHKIRDIVGSEIREKGIISRNTLNNLEDLALSYEIIPSPLLRAAYYGEMELMLESLEGLSKAQIEEAKTLISKSPFASALYAGLSSDELEGRIDKIFSDLKNRGSVGFFAKSETGEPTSENRPLFFIRAQYLLDLLLFDTQVSPLVSGKTVDLITSSGFIDVADSYARYAEERDKLTLGRVPKELTRGKCFTLHLGKKSGGYVYLNDTKKLGSARERARSTVARIKELSLDTLLFGGLKAIAETPIEEGTTALMNREEWKPSSKDEILSCNTPAIVLAHGGMGKTILASQLAEGLLEKPMGVPLIINSDELNEWIRYSRINRPEELKALLESRVSEKPIPPLLKREVNLVYLIDDFHHLNPDYRRLLEGAARDISADGGQVVLFSRYELGFIPEGFRVFRIAPLKDRAREGFLELRIRGKGLEEAKGVISKLGESIAGNYLGLAVLGGLFSADRGHVMDYITDERMRELFKKDYKPTKAQVLSCLVDFITGLDLERQETHYKLPPEKMRGRILSRLEALGSLATAELEKQLPGIGRLANLECGGINPIDSSLLYNKGESQVFRHETFAELLLARRIASAINEGELTMDRFREHLCGYFTLEILDPNAGACWKPVRNCVELAGLVVGLVTNHNAMDAIVDEMIEAAKPLMWATPPFSPFLSHIEEITEKDYVANRLWERVDGGLGLSLCHTKGDLKLKPKWQNAYSPALNLEAKLVELFLDAICSDLMLLGTPMAQGYVEKITSLIK